MSWAALLLVFGCGAEPVPEPEPEPESEPLILLVSWDTTRADALGCYGEQSHWDLAHPGGPAPQTPVADALAARGTRFAWALTHAPTTLSAHTALFSGLDSHGHQVVRNGFPVPGEVPLLAERFAAAGYDTIGVVGASVLEARMGLGRGFRVYDDAVSSELGDHYEDPADVVVSRTLAQVDARSGPGPLFLFVHFFDAHAPWTTAPEAVRADLLGGRDDGGFDGSDAAIRGLVVDTVQGKATEAAATGARARYLAEVAWQDTQLGVLLTGLETRGLMQDSLVVLLSDHGEIFDEVPERPYRHGMDVDLAAIHVPLIVSGQGRFAGGEGVVVPRQVRLMDVAPTLLGRAGLSPELGEGEDLAPLVAISGHGSRMPPGPVHFAEASKPFSELRRDAWPNLSLSRAAANEGAIYLNAPWLGDQTTLHSLAPGQPSLDDVHRFRRLGGALQGWDRSAPGLREVALHPETQAALEALGYLGAERPGPPPVGP